MLRLHRLAVSLSLCSAFVLFVFSPQPAQAKYEGGDNPGCPPTRPSSYSSHAASCLSRLSSSAGSGVSLTEGNAGESYPVTNLESSTGPTLSLSLTYSSYNADGSRAAIDTGMGYGWTNTYDDFLFSQRGDMFRMDADGRITRFEFVGNGTYQTSTGYFETLVQNVDGTFTLTDKFQTVYHYISVPGTFFQVGGPVYRLDTTTDRIGNVTTMGYSGGDLTSTTDTYGRTVTYEYDSRHHLTHVTDPLGRTTTFGYDSTDRKLTTITDPNGKTTTYGYNTLYQITNKTDGDGRTFTYGYQHNLPATDHDASDRSFYSLSNTSNWATDATQLAMNLMRMYVPSTTTRVDGRGNSWTYTYDNHGYPASIVAPDGSTTTYSYDPGTLRIVSTTDADGHTTSYTYDSQGNELTVKDALGYTTTYTYEPMFNQVTSMTDPNGRTTTYTYDSHGNRLSATDPLGDVWKYTYDAVGNPISMTDPNDNLTTYQYDGLNRLIETTDALDGTVTKVYDDVGDVLQVTDQNGHTTQYQYDVRSRLIQKTDALGKSETYTYDANNNVTSVTDRDGHTTTYTYDVQNRLIRTTDALGHATSTTYDPVGNVLSVTDADGHMTNYMYDVLNRKTQMRDALGEVTTYGYDLIGTPVCSQCTGPTLGSSLVTKHTDANGKVIYHTYDGLDREVLEIRKQGGTSFNITPSDAVTRYTYDAMSNRLTMTEPDGNTTNYSYDALNRQVRMVNAAGDTTITTYDPVGNVGCVTAPNLNVICHMYDALNRPIKESDSQGTVWTRVYDPVSNLLTQLDGNGNGSSYAYDADNRVVTMTDALGKPTQYSYDPVGNEVSTVDRDGNTTSYTYDAINRRITMTDAQPATTQWQYDNVGNLIKLTDANLHATSYTYDAVNRRLTEKYPDLSHNTVIYTYDAVGNRISRTNQKGQLTTYNYSDLYFLTSRVYPSGTDTFTFDLSGRVLTGNTTRGSGWNESFAYDGANRVIQSVQNSRTISYVYNVPARIRMFTYPGGRSITELMDFRNQLSTVNDGGMAPIAQYTYDAAEREMTRSYRNGTAAIYAYNANNWVLSLTHAMGDHLPPDNLIVGFTYAFDNEGNKQYEQKLHERTHSEGYSYDPVYRLIDYKVGTLVGSTITMVVTQSSYNLDPLGNWNSKDTDGMMQTRTHSPSNEIATIDTTPILSDNNGNTSDDGTNLYSYDEENRLTKVMVKATSAILGQYRYDTFGRRVSKIDNFGVQTFYYYDGWRTIEEQSSAGLTQATYVFGNYLDEALTMDRGGQTFYYHQNTLWSSYALSDSTGTGVEGYSYDAYGYQTVVLPGPDGKLDFDSDDVYLPGGKSSYGNPFLYTGQRYDPESGFNYYKNRYNSTFFGRFMSRDPIGYAVGDMNLYAYVVDNPTNLTDSSGSGCYYMLKNPCGGANSNSNSGQVTKAGSATFDVAAGTASLILPSSPGLFNPSPPILPGPGPEGGQVETQKVHFKKQQDASSPKIYEAYPTGQIPVVGPVMPTPGPAPNPECQWTPMAPPCPLHICTIVWLPECDGLIYIPSFANFSLAQSLEPNPEPNPDPLYCLRHPGSPGCWDFQSADPEDYYKMDEKGKSKGKVATKYSLITGKAGIAVFNSGASSSSGIIGGMDGWGYLAAPSGGPGSGNNNIIIQDQWGI